MASGGVWKTTNAGTTWTPVFDDEGSYSIGCVVLDPKNPNTVWVGTGENNSQRSVGYGDGVYKSIDGGRTWKNVGLKNSEHIGKILIDPRDSNIVYVAAQGPLWGPGGDRGLYKTTDGGKTWKKILNVSENTGVTDVVQDPRHPDIMLAAAYQRRRHVWTLIDGGPEGALYRTTDGGKTWTKVKSGLPAANIGRIGLAMAPSDPDTIYAIIEAADKQGGIFRSSNGGVTWEKRNPFDTQAQYYAHLVVDPKNKDRHLCDERAHPDLRRWRQVADRTAGSMGSTSITTRSGSIRTTRITTSSAATAASTRALIAARNWRHADNLPITQFYDFAVEQVESPFYQVYGGTQDNNTLGGPARTMSAHGIMNGDWHVIVGGDGFQCQVDPKDPNIVYAESQYGGLVRYDWRTGQRVPIQPQPGQASRRFAGTGTRRC